MYGDNIDEVDNYWSLLKDREKIEFCFENIELDSNIEDIDNIIYETINRKIHKNERGEVKIGEDLIEEIRRLILNDTQYRVKRILPGHTHNSFCYTKMGLGSVVVLLLFTLTVPQALPAMLNAVAPCFFREDVASYKNRILQAIEQDQAERDSIEKVFVEDLSILYKNYDNFFEKEKAARREKKEAIRFEKMPDRNLLNQTGNASSSTYKEVSEQIKRGIAAPIISSSAEGTATVATIPAHRAELANMMKEFADFQSA